MSTRSAALGLAVLLAAACDARQSVEAGGAAALALNLGRAPLVEIHVEDESAADDLRLLAALERERGGPTVLVKVRSAGDPRAARIVVGTPGTPRSAALAERAGVALAADPPRFRIADVDHDRPEDAARFVFEDPERPGLPVTLWLGNDLARLTPQIEDALPRATPAFASWRGGEPALAGALGVRGGILPREVERVGQARLALRGRASGQQLLPGFRVESGAELDPAAVELALAQVAAAGRRAASFAGSERPEVDVRLVAVVEDFLLSGEAQRLGRWNRVRPAAEMLVFSGVTDGGAAAARAALRAVLGPAVVPWIEEGAAVSAAGSWFGRDLERHLARLVAFGGARSAARVVDPASDAQLSSHVLAPLRAALFDHLRAERGDAYVRGLWTGTRALAVDADLDASFAAALEARVARLREEVRHRGAQRRESVLAQPPTLGAVLVESGPGPRRGYGSRGAQASLAALSAAGFSSVALRADFAAQVLSSARPAARPLAPLAGDTALFAALLSARGAGLRTVLHAHLLASEAGTYSGGWSRAGEEEWRVYFEELAAAVEHAGHLAGLAGVEWLGVGSALRTVSAAEPAERRSRPEEPRWRRAGWRGVIGAARGAFAGGITYSAEDVLEAEQVGFWSDLDALAIELDPRVDPAAPVPRADLALRLAAELELAGLLARAAGRPLLVTHASFAPVLSGRSAPAGAWLDAQLRLLAESLAGVWDAGLDARGLWLARFATDPADRGFGRHDPLLAPDAPGLGELRAAFQRAARSPR
ncbi:MAG: hypothetical protein JNK02_14265 [Planctomycetes bacterium]|nr:hypothetical protein [Planctomycetota bacterium]